MRLDIEVRSSGPGLLRRSGPMILARSSWPHTRLPYWHALTMWGNIREIADGRRDGVAIIIRRAG